MNDFEKFVQIASERLESLAIDNNKVVDVPFLEATLAWSLASGWRKAIGRDSSYDKLENLDDESSALENGLTHAKFSEYLNEVRIEDLAVVAGCLNKQESAWAEVQKLLDEIRGPLKGRLSKNPNYSGLEHLFDEPFDNVQSHIFSQAPSMQNAPDLKQRIGTFSGLASLKCWLNTVATNQVTSHIRKENRKKPLPTELPSRGSQEDSGAISDIIDDEINQLNDQQQLIARMIFGNGLSGKEVAEKLGITAAAVSQNKSKIVKILRARLKSEEIHFRDSAF